MRMHVEPSILDELAIVDEELSDDWRQRAECAHYTGLVDFFPARGESAREAKAICAACPVQRECLDYALQSEAAYGVWGGLTERERHRMKRDRRRTDRRVRL